MANNSLQESYASYVAGTLPLDGMIEALYPFISRRTLKRFPWGMQAEADDVTQNIVLELYKRFPKDIANITAWILARIRSRYLDVMRKSGRSLDEQPDETTPENISVNEGWDFPVPDDLTEFEREVVWGLSDGQPEREIASSLGSTQPTVHRAIVAIRGKFAQMNQDRCTHTVTVCERLP